jgi:Plasmid pRiA4b ORF-3-like protein
MKTTKVVPKSMLFRLSVRDVVPEIWRKLLVSSETTLEGLHSVLQVLMGWEDRHLYAFVIDAKRYASPNDSDDNLENQEKIRMKLSRLFKAGAETITYEYDFGDKWQIVLTAEPIDQGYRPSQFPECVGGSRHGPVEDSGGSRAYMEKALIYRNPKHRRYLDVQKLIGPNFNPEAFDLTETNARLKAIA